MKKNNFWKNKIVFITGHTGFKGSWLTLILSSLGARVFGYALNPISKPNFFDGAKLTQFLKSLGYDGILVLEDAERPNDYAEAVLFTKEQSKHATENAGTFLENPDLYTKAPKKDAQIPA